MSNKDHTRLGAEFQNEVQKWFTDHYIGPFELEKQILIGNSEADIKRYHKFDIISETDMIAVECKRYTWTTTGNVPSAKIRSINEDVLHLILLQGGYTKYIVMLKSHHPKQKESLAEYYHRMNSHLLGNIKVAEYDPEKNDLRIL